MPASTRPECTSRTTLHDVTAAAVGEIRTFRSGDSTRFGEAFWTGSGPDATVCVVVDSQPTLEIRVTMKPGGGFESVTVQPRGTAGGNPADAPPIGTRTLRSIPWGDVERVATHHVHQSNDYLANLFERSPISDTPKLRDAFAKTLQFSGGRRPGRAGTPDLERARLAARYVELCRSGPGAAKALAAEEHCSTANVRNRLNTARSKGLLTSPPPGRQGGELTSYARRLLSESTEASSTDVSDPPGPDLRPHAPTPPPDHPNKET